MKRAILIVSAVLALAMAMGCTYVRSAQGGNASQTNEAWFTEVTALGALPLSTRVYYCPPATGGAATCIQAEMIEGASAGGSAATDPAMGGMSDEKPMNEEPMNEEMADEEM